MKHIILGIALLTSAALGAQDCMTAELTVTSTTTANVEFINYTTPPGADYCIVQAVGYVGSAAAGDNGEFVTSGHYNSSSEVPVGYGLISWSEWLALADEFTIEGLFAPGLAWNGVAWVNYGTNTSGLGLSLDGYGYNNTSGANYTSGEGVYLYVGSYQINSNNQPDFIIIRFKYTLTEGFTMTNIGSGGNYIGQVYFKSVPVVTPGDDPTVYVYNCEVVDTVYTTVTEFVTDTVYVEVEGPGSNDCPTDLDGNGLTSASDLLIFLAFFETVCE